MAAHQAPLSLGFFRQEHWSGLPFPSPMHESENEVAQSCPTPSDPMDCSLPGSSIQARVLEWGAIAFSVLMHMVCYFRKLCSHLFPSKCFFFFFHFLKTSISRLLIQFSSVTQSCPTFCDPMNHSTPGHPVHHHLPEFTQTHVH